MSFYSRVCVWMSVFERQRINITGAIYTLNHLHTHTHTHTPRAYAHARTHTCTHTHTHTRTHARIQSHTHTHTITGDLLVEWEKKKGWVGADQYAEEKRWVFSFDLKDWRRMPNRERKRVPDHRSDVLKGPLPQGPPAHARNTEYPSIRGWAEENEKESRELWSNSKNGKVSDWIPHWSCRSIFFSVVIFLCWFMSQGGEDSSVARAQWTRVRKVPGSSPRRSGGRMSFSRVNFLCWLLFRYPFHLRVTAAARKRSRWFCQKCWW